MKTPVVLLAVGLYGGVLVWNFLRPNDVSADVLRIFGAAGLLAVFRHVRAEMGWAYPVLSALALAALAYFVYSLVSPG